MKNNHNLIWIDLEMTGLNPEENRIIEIATIVTDAQLNIIAEGPVLAVCPTTRPIRCHGLVEYTST